MIQYKIKSQQQFVIYNKVQQKHSSFKQYYTNIKQRQDKIVQSKFSSYIENVKRSILTVSIGLAISQGCQAKELVGVNKPQLLPKEANQTVIDVKGTLNEYAEKRLTKIISYLERDTGIKLRVLAQAYPETPGLAIKDYWKVDDDTVVLVEDTGLGNAVNINVGGNIDLQVPQQFWGRLRSAFGTKDFIKKNGETDSILKSVYAIDSCLREPEGEDKCKQIKDDYEETTRTRLS